MSIYKKLLFSVITFNLYLVSVHATESNFNTNLMSFLKSSYIASFSIGPNWVNPGQTQTLELAPNITKTYTANNPDNTLLSGELFLGLKKSLAEKIEGQIGLAFVSTGSAMLSGNIWDDADPTFNNYTYQYEVSHTAIALKGKLLGHVNLPIIPWISASFGVGFNNAHGFDNTPTIEEAAQMPNFTSHTIRAFTYTLGIGIQRQITPQWQAGMGYEFADWGKSQLGQASGQTSNTSLTLSHLYTHSFLFNITYLA